MRKQSGVLIGWVVALMCLSTGVTLASDVDVTPDAAAFLARVDELRRGAGIPGLSVAVLKDQTVVLAAGLGFADVDRRIPATAETPYDIASVSKPLSAVVALRLVESGVLDLDRPIAEYSEWADFCARFSKQPSIFARNLRCEPATHTLRHMLSHTAAGVPGTAFSYNPIVYSWASRPIMSATDTPFSTLVAEHVLEPADMRDSARKHRKLPLPEALAARLAQPYQLDDAGTVSPSPPRPPQGDGAAGGVVSTVLDLAKFDAAFDRGVLVSAESRDAMMNGTRFGEGRAFPYGVGWWVQDYRGEALAWHGGWWEDAWSALYLKVPKHNVTLILLANSEGIWWGNPLDDAAVEGSPFAMAFLSAFVPGMADANED
ncbi:MAG: serine hydrolase domain-containing protein [Pseudomonadota bacterium]